MTSVSDPIARVEAIEGLSGFHLDFYDCLDARAGGAGAVASRGAAAACVHGKSSGTRLGVPDHRPRLGQARTAGDLPPGHHSSVALTPRSPLLPGIPVHT